MMMMMMMTIRFVAVAETRRQNTHHRLLLRIEGHVVQAVCRLRQSAWLSFEVGERLRQGIVQSDLLI